MADKEQGKLEGQDIAPQETATAPDKTGQPTGATFTQEQVDALIKDRLRRQSDKFKDYDDLKKKAARVDELDNANKSDLEKLQDQLTKAANEAETLKKQLRDNAVQSAITGEALKMGFIDPSDALIPAVLSAVTLGEDGKAEGAAEALKELAKAKPYLIKGDQPKPAAPGTNAGSGNQPASGGAVLTAGEQAAVNAALASGYIIDPAKVAQRKKDARLVTQMEG